MLCDELICVASTAQRAQTETCARGKIAEQPDDDEPLPAFFTNTNSEVSVVCAREEAVVDVGIVGSGGSTLSLVFPQTHNIH